MAAAVVVTSPGGATTPECPIFLQANEAIVAATQQFIDWRPAPADAAGAARVSLNTFQAVKAFAPRCIVSRNTGADINAAITTNLLEVRFTDAFWSRVLTELKASGVFADRITTVGGLHDAIQAATLVNPANLEIVAADWRPAQAFANGPNGGGANAIARAALAQVRFYSLLSVSRLEWEHGAVLPFIQVSTVVGILGACLTQAARQSETSSVRLIADSLRATYGNVVPLPSDGALAVYATKLLPNMRMPFPLHAIGVGETELREEYEDGLVYNTSADGRRTIEEKRVLLLGSTARGYATTALSPARQSEPHGRHRRRASDTSAVRATQPPQKACF